MASKLLAEIRELFEHCSDEEQTEFFRELRERFIIHEFEEIIGAPAEMILEAVHRAPELTRRMLRGVIADAAFRMHVVQDIQTHGWNDITPEGNFAYDYKLDDGAGPITVQIKLQRSEQGTPAKRKGDRYGFQPEIYIVETQKTRTGTDVEDNKTRPYRYGEFDILAVSMQPSTGRWDQFMYTLGRWLLPAKNPDMLATIQPVSMSPNEYWTDSFLTAAKWLRTDNGKKQMSVSRKEKSPVSKKLRVKGA